MPNESDTVVSHQDRNDKSHIPETLPVPPRPAASNFRSRSPIQILRSLEKQPSALKLWWSRSRGMMFILMAEIFGAFMIATTKLLENSRGGNSGMHPFQILFARMTITWLLSSLYMSVTKTPDFPLGAKGVRLLLVLRGCCGFVGVFGLYYSLQYLPLSEATVITFLVPMFTAWVGALYLHQPITRKEGLAGLISFTGIICISAPDLISSHANPHLHHSDAPSPPEVSNSKRIIAIAIALLGDVGGVGAYTTIRQIGSRAHPLLSVSYYAFICTVVSTGALVAVPSIHFELPANLLEWSLLALLGIFGFLLQFLLTAGLAADKSSKATNMMYTQVLFALVLDRIIWGTVPGVSSAFGCVLITASTLWVTLMQGVKKENKEVVVAGDEEIGFLVESDGEEEGKDGMELRELAERGN